MCQELMPQPFERERERLIERGGGGRFVRKGKKVDSSVQCFCLVVILTQFVTPFFFFLVPYDMTCNLMYLCYYKHVNINNKIILDFKII